MQDLNDFLEPINLVELNGDTGYNDGQFAKNILLYQEEMPDIGDIDVVIIGVSENRGGGVFKTLTHGPNNVRKQLYQLYYWHSSISIADLGNIKAGATLSDTYAALKTVMAELVKLKKTVIIIGGSHDITLAQYFAYQNLNKIVAATCIDAQINLRSELPERNQNFLMEMLTGEPNHIKHYSHIGFQSYYVHPRLLETMNKLHFDCYRLGVVKEKIEEMEPVLRSTHLVSFDISAIKSSDAPAAIHSPNGFSGEEACTLAQYAGMSESVSSFGIYGYLPQDDIDNLSAIQIAQMIWYFIDGKYRALQEASLNDRDNFNEFNCSFTDIATTFLQSKKTNRWWMQLPNKKFIACSYSDYVNASHNNIPERWLRAQERE